MIATRPYTNYDSFAWFYNKFWSARLIDQIYWTVEKYFLERLTPGCHILDVCCGNGHLTQKMTAQGFKVTGFDVSYSMLEHARENAPGCDFYVMDACNYKFDHQFDGAISTCDSLNHIMSFSLLRKALANTFNVLKPGGLFMFDLNTIEGYHKYWTGEQHARIEDDNVIIIKLKFDNIMQQSSFEVTTFRLIDGQWVRSDAFLTQQFYAPEAIKVTLEDIGFEDIEFYDVEKDLKVDGTGRMMFVARKK